MNNFKNKNFKVKIAAIITVLALSVISCAGCGKSDDAVKVTTDTGVTDLGGVTVRNGLINYYVYEAAARRAYADTSFTGDLAAYDWEKVRENGVRLGEEIKKEAFDKMAARELLAKFAEEKGVTLTEDEKNAGKQSIDEFKSENGEERLLTNIAALGLSSEDDYLALYENETLYTKIESDFGTMPEKYTDGINLEDYANENFVSVKHVLIKNDSEKYDNPKATAEKVLELAKQGEDFNKLMEEYNEDPGEGEGGYTFGRGEMVAEFETASFNLGFNEISEIVETEYGYHIIKRITGMSELEAYLLSGLDKKTEEEAIKNVSVKEIMTNINNALNKIKEEQKAATTSKG